MQGTTTGTRPVIAIDACGEVPGLLQSEDDLACQSLGFVLHLASRYSHV